MEWAFSAGLGQPQPSLVDRKYAASDAFVFASHAQQVVDTLP